MAILVPYLLVYIIVIIGNRYILLIAQI